ILDARAAALRDNLVGYNLSPTTIIKNFIRDRRNYLASRLAPATNAPFAAVSTSTNGNVLTLRGTAPIQVDWITINGARYPISWNSVSNTFLAPTSWTAQVVMVPGLNNFTIAAYDAAGALVRGPVVVHGEYNGPVAEARDSVMITEIMYRASQPGAEYVELFNKAPNFSFDLSGWRLDGLEFEFPSGAILGPNQFLLVAKDQVTFGSAFTGQSAFYTYAGELDAAAETLSLLKGATGEVIDRVRYESSAPWPPNANGRGSALQVIDINEDNSRVSNWSDGLPWRYVTFTGTILGSALPTSRGTNFLIFLNLPGTVYIDDLVLVRGSVPEAGENVLANGDFEAPLEATWIPAGNHSGSSRSTEASHSGLASLKVASTGVGSSIAHVRQVIPGNPTNAIYTLSFWFIPSTNAAQLTTRTAPGSGFIFQTPVMPVVATPGQSNSFVMDLPPYDPVWLNEVGTTSADSCAQWVELYNSGTNIVSLSNYELAGQSLDPHTIAPGEFKVICLPADEFGSQRLTRTIGSMTQIVDYFNYASTPYGAVPDGQPFARGPLRYPTRGISNLAPRIASISRVGNFVYLTVQVVPGHRYGLEYKNDLNQAGWTFLQNIIGDEPEQTYAYPLEDSQRFYRLTLLP
ncbi:MAG TPA: lamin tail domain-containing protein, partial [Verrucomicrobiae bacterium]|nr:lamin tail domain-containing protein [Verrucomicrobiae bacterium]